MAEERSLLRPLRSDNLKPRSSPQAVWEPGPASVPDPVPASAVNPHLHAVMELPPAPEAPTRQESSQPEALELDDVIASIITPEEDDEELIPEPDAVPTDQMPEPVCVPLYEALSSVPKRRIWPWLILTAAVLLAAFYTAWTFGWLNPNWA